MATPAIKSKHRPRELRRRVMVPARIWTGAQWGDGRILNISTRGLMIQTARPVPEGSLVEILRGDHLIMARVVWSEAGRSGLHAEERLPVEDILSVGQARAVQLIASNGTLHDRRTGPRGVTGDPRSSGRATEFVAVAVIALSLAIGVWAMAQHALAGPLAAASAALGG